MRAQTPPKQGAELLKTDLLAVLAHPDDETGMAGTLAAYALGKTSVVAAVYCTRGEGGGNMVGTHSGRALGHLREAELRDCLNTLGVRYCYFLDCLDWAYTESAAATFQKWNKEETLAQLVRLVRALRPDVILTMNPAPNPGQHGHHQAAGILAIEAFSAAADSGRFPLQLSREGLEPWQVRKLYYGGGNAEFTTTVDVTQPILQGATPASVAARALVHHRSQAFGNIASSPWLQRPQKYALVKSFVPVSVDETDLLAGVGSKALKEVRFPAASRPLIGLEFVPRRAVASYRGWAEAQGLAHVTAQFKADLPVVAGEANETFLALHNGGADPLEGSLRVTAPAGWSVQPESLPVRLPAGAQERIPIRVTPPPDALADVQISASLSAGEELNATAQFHPVPKTTAKRVETAPALHELAAGWEAVAPLSIDPGRVWQGKVQDAADNSARVRLQHDGRTLFVEVRVRDDVVVTNIAPNDIRGHWRSDSVELCLDPAGGAEHTLGCYKLGIFPFDATGVVRAARDADANPGLVEETAPQTRLVSWRTADGYQIRAAIPFREIGLSWPAQRSVGFNVLIYDGDKRDAAPGENINESRLAWAPRPGVMGRPEDWGRLELE